MCWACWYAYRIRVPKPLSSSASASIEEGTISGLYPCRFLSSLASWQRTFLCALTARPPRGLVFHSRTLVHFVVGANRTSNTAHTIYILLLFTCAHCRWPKNPTFPNSIPFGGKIRRSGSACVCQCLNTCHTFCWWGQQRHTQIVLFAHLFVGYMGTRSTRLMYRPQIHASISLCVCGSIFAFFARESLPAYTGRSPPNLLLCWLENRRQKKKHKNTFSCFFFVVWRRFGLCFFFVCLLFLVSFLAIAGGMTNTSGACIPKPNRRWQQHTTQHNCGWRTVHDKFPQAPPPVWNQSNKYNRKIEQQKKYI